MIEVREADFSVDQTLLQLKQKEVGCVVSFVGIVRGFSEGRKIEKMELQVYEEMAKKHLEEIRADTMKQFSINDIIIIHRSGTLQVSDNIVLIAVAAAHRAEAFEACRHILEQLKQKAPIWKKEFTQDESYWKEDASERKIYSPIKMVDVSEKPIVKRMATASGKICLKRETIQAIQQRKTKKGDVLSIAEIAAILAAKKTAETLPLCHQIPLSVVHVEFEIKENYIKVYCQTFADYKTGVEMEALVGATAALLTIWDMVKYLEKDDKGQYPTAKIDEVTIIEKRKEMNE